MQRTPASGFTLIELIVTVAIAGILVAVAVPSFRDYISNQRVKSVAYDLVASLNYARSEAVKRNANATVTSGTSWAEGWTVAAGGGDLKTYDPEDAVIIEATPSSATTITYGGNGRVSGTAVTFSICDLQNSHDVTERVVRIDLTGRPNIELGDPCDEV